MAATSKSFPTVKVIGSNGQISLGKKLETLNELLQMTWNQVCRDPGLKWEKILKAAPPSGVSALYSLRITQSRRATAYRDGEILRFLSIREDHDAT